MNVKALAKSIIKDLDEIKANELHTGCSVLNLLYDFNENEKTERNELIDDYFENLKKKMNFLGKTINTYNKLLKNIENIDIDIKNHEENDYNEKKTPN